MHKQSIWNKVVGGNYFYLKKLYAFNRLIRDVGLKVVIEVIHVDVLQIRLDDVIYLIILAGLMVLFNIIATDSSSTLFLAFRTFCVLMFISSMICLFIRPGVKYFLLLIFSVFIPATMYSVYNSILSMDPTQTKSLQKYVGYISLCVVYIFTILVYPIKGYIQQKIGSLYSYLYGLSVITLLGLWPTYSLLQQLASTGSITLSIIYNNKALVISFIVIIVFSFYLIVHNTFFEGDKDKLLKILKNLFTSEQITKAIDEMQQTYIKQEKWHNIKTRVMSFIVLGTTLGLQIFIFLNMSSQSSSILKSFALMIFAMIFLILGTFYIVIPLNNKFAIPIFTVLSLAPAPLSFFYSQYFLYWEYICTIFSLPYVILFWSVIRGINEYKPLTQNKFLTVMYIFIHIPIMVFMMDVLNYFGSGNKVGPVGYTAITIVGVSIGVAVLFSIISFLINVCSKQTQTIKNTVQLDFNYQQKQINYKPYKKLNTFTLQWLSELNLLEYGIFLNSLFYLISNTIVFYSLNQLIYNYKPSYFFSSIIYQLTYSEFLMLFVFFVYCHYFMSTDNDTWDLWMLLFWVAAGLVSIIISFIITIVPFTFRIFGGFCFIMFVIAVGFQYVKDSNKKIIPFVAPVLIICLWMAIVIPYVVGIPTASIYADQSYFGEFIYQCILASALLLIIIVGIVSMIFNILMNKFEQQKRYKFVIEDVKQYFDQEGIQSNDQILHVFHQAYQSRDKKYIFYLKNGYPINVLKDQEKDTYKLITFNDFVNKRTTQNLPKQKQKEVDCCWSCLTCFCGEDEQQIEEKLKGALQKNLVSEQEAQKLFPEEKFQRLNKMAQTNKWGQKEDKNKKAKRIKPEDVNSTKSLLLNSMNQGSRKLGPQYTLLKLQKSRDLAIEIWSSIFNFVSNPDSGEQMSIYNDFVKFCDLSKLGISPEECQSLFNKHAKSSWGQTVGMNEEQFSCCMQQIADKFYHSVIQNERQRVMVLLVDRVYYNLARYRQFNQMRSKYEQDSTTNKNVRRNLWNQAIQRYKLVEKDREKQVQSLVRFHKKQKGHLDENQKNRKDSAGESKRKKIQSINELQDNQQKQKTKSCKRSIYDNYLKIRDSCSNITPKEQNKIAKRQNIKPWNYLAQQSAKILHRKESLWQDQHEVKQYQFRIILNNIFMAVFKLADLYAYLEITIRDPQVKWYDTAQFSFLYIDYKYQLYLCLALAFITVPLGLKGISFISQDRLGLTEARVPAGFPHPMFFYTVIYKILVLSLFATISSTLLVTFSCQWTAASPPYTLYQDPTIECLSFQHNIYIMLSLIFLIVYFPLSSYTFPNFQFSQKRLDLKFRPSYLVFYFQINFVLAANKVLLSQASDSQTVEIAFCAINIVSLLFLSLVCLRMKPCLIEWFNWIQFLTIFLGFIWNVGGLVLYLTKMWTLCVIVFGGISVVTIVIVFVIIKRVYFSTASVNIQNDEDEVKQLQLGRKYKNQKNRLIIAQNNHLGSNGSKELDLQKMTNNFLTSKSNMQKTKRNKDQQLIMVDLISNTEDAEVITSRSASKQ